MLDVIGRAPLSPDEAVPSLAVPGAIAVPSRICAYDGATAVPRRIWPGLGPMAVPSRICACDIG